MSVKSKELEPAILSLAPACERFISVSDPKSGLRAFVALHSLSRGPAFGGIRRRHFESETQAVLEVHGLAEAMSYKCALAGLPAGGGKSVILDHADLDVDKAYEALGRVVEELGGNYVCGPDVGTGPEHLIMLRRSTSFVNPEENNAGASTARGVLAGLRGVLQVLDGSASAKGRRILIQGLGQVGSSLAQTLADEGAELWGVEPKGSVREQLGHLRINWLTEDSMVEAPCEIFMPCALGGVLSEERVRGAKWKAICGAANNQLADDAVADLMVQREILWAPDFLVNAGAVIEGVLSFSPRPLIREQVFSRIDQITQKCVDILSHALSEGRSSHRVALAIAANAISTGAQPSNR